MTSKPLLMGALSIGAIIAIAGCGGASNASTPTPSTGGLTLPNIPGLSGGRPGRLQLRIPCSLPLTCRASLATPASQPHRRVLGDHLHLLGHDRQWRWRRRDLCGAIPGGVGQAALQRRSRRRSAGRPTRMAAARFPCRGWGPARSRRSRRIRSLTPSSRTTTWWCSASRRERRAAPRWTLRSGPPRRLWPVGVAAPESSSVGGEGGFEPTVL